METHSVSSIPGESRAFLWVLLEGSVGKIAGGLCVVHGRDFV